MDSKDLAEALGSIKSRSDKLYIIGHKGFCYDVIGSAFGLSRIAESVGLDSVICGEFYQGWGYPQNNMIYNMFDLAKIIRKPSEIKKGSPVAYVDVFPDGSNCYDVRGKTEIVLNHHPLGDSRFDPGSVRFADIREAGSTVALVADHMISLDIGLTEADRDLATLMLYGMRVDTKRYLKGDTRLDHHVSPFLAEHADMEVLEKLESKRYPAEIKNIMKHLLEKEEGKYRVAVTRVNKPGLVPQLADFLSQFEGCPISLVVAKAREKGEKRWYVSGRSKSAAYNVGELINELFSCGGGHWHAGGAALKTDEMFDRFGVDETADESVLEQLLGSMVGMLKEMSDDK